VSDAKTYWASRYGHAQGVAHHSRQNDQITTDFFRNLKYLGEQDKGYVIGRTLRRARRVIEIGCGTGEMSAAVANFRRGVVLGTDLSPEAVVEAAQRYPQASFQVLDIQNDDLGHLNGYNLAVCSNVLEHFKNPHPIIDRMLQIADTCLILVPYNQPLSDGYDSEGGAGHVYTFTRSTFTKHYKVLDGFLFKTEGWQHSTNGENPRQYAVLVEKTNV